MKTKLVGLFFISVATATLFGCGGGDTSTTTDGGSTATPTPAPGATATPALTCNTIGGGFSVLASGTAEGFYIPNATSTVSSVTLSFSPSTSGDTGSKSFTVVARGCGFTGTQIGTATTSKNLALSGNYYATTFTFSPALAVQNCSGQGRIAFTVTNASGGTVYFGAQHGSGSSCGMTVSQDNTSVTPSARAGDWAVTGSFVSP